MVSSGGKSSGLLGSGSSTSSAQGLRGEGDEEVEDDEENRLLALDLLAVSDRVRGLQKNLN